MTAPAIRLDKVSKAFGDHVVLDRVSLEVPSGRCTFVAGPSGTGKSVLVRHVVGLLRPDAGQVHYRGTRVDTLPEEDLLELRKRCVYVFQHPTLFDSMNVLDNVALVVKYHRARDRKQAEELAAMQLDRMGLSHRAASRPQELPAGEQKLVSLARALALDPETLILDEPTTGLDPYAAAELDRQVATLRDSGVTLIVISHDLASIRRLAHDVVFLFNGKIRLHAPVHSFFDSADHVVQQFVQGRADGEM